MMRSATESDDVTQALAALERAERWATEREAPDDFAHAPAIATARHALSARVGLLEQVVEAFRVLHAQACDDYWTDDECACGGRQLLAALDKQEPQT